ncbi:MAG: Gfo/Idh/MocA family oxidoreductase [Bacteroidota bacterium]
MEKEEKTLFEINRREFLKKITIAAGSSLVLSSMPWLKILGDEQIGRSVNNKVRLGFIGIGDRGSVLLKNVQAFESILNVEIAAVCDDYEPNYQRAKMFTNGKARAFYDYRELISMKDIDGVVIATPLHEHARTTVDALNAGKNVFCEKAMARNLDDTKLMYDTYTRSKCILQIGHQRMFSPVFIEALKQIHDGAIGQISQIRANWHRATNWRRHVPKPEFERKINWRLYENYSAGLFTELLSHQIQVANWINKATPVSVISNGSINYWKDGREVYDNIACIFDYADGSNFIYDSQNCNKHYGCEEQVIGSKGTMELEINKYYSAQPPPPPAILQLINNLEKDIFDVIPIGGASWVPETAVKYKGVYIAGNYKMDETKLQLEAFTRYIRNGSAPEELTKEGYNASVWSLLAEKAAKTRERITLDEKYRI